MTISEQEQEALEIIEDQIGESLLEVAQLERYSFGYYIHDQHITGLSLYSCRLSSIKKK